MSKTKLNPKKANVATKKKTATKPKAAKNGKRKCAVVPPIAVEPTKTGLWQRILNFLRLKG